MNKPDICIPGSSKVFQNTTNVFTGIFNLYTKAFHQYRFLIVSIIRSAK